MSMAVENNCNAARFPRDRIRIGAKTVINVAFVICVRNKYPAHKKKKLAFSMFSYKLLLYILFLLFFFSLYSFLFSPLSILFLLTSPDIAAFLYVALGISGAIMMVVRMRRVRKQLNEFRLMTVSSEVSRA